MSVTILKDRGGCDRKVIIKDDRDTQSVNVCNYPHNKRGSYSEVQYFAGKWRIDQDWISRYGNFETFQQELRDRAYRQIKDSI